MAVWKARIGYSDPNQLGDQNYSFNIHVTATSTATAWSRAENVANALLETVLTTAQYVTSIGVSNPDVVNGTLIIPQNTAGSRAVTGAPLPSWNCARFQLAGNLGERLHTFYLRMGLTEDDVNGQTLTVTAASAVGSCWAGLLAINACCDKDGFVFAYGANDNLVHMRQPAWRRRTRPGFRRGWVPV